MGRSDLLPDAERHRRVPAGQTNSGSLAGPLDSTNLYVLVSMQDDDRRE